MKKFNDFYLGENIVMSEIGMIWGNILAQDIKYILFTKEEFTYFYRYFEPKFPFNWNKKTFQGVKLIIK